MAQRVGSNAASGNPATVREQNHIFGHPELSPRAQILAVVVLNYQALDLGACVLSRQRLGQQLGVSPRMVATYLAELRAIGWLVETPRPGRTPLRRIVLRPRLVAEGSFTPPVQDPSPQKEREKGRGNLKPPRWALQVQREVREERDAVADSYGGVIPAE